MAQRLPIPGEDNNAWGIILNDFLLTAHNTDGTLKSTALESAGVVKSINSLTPTNGALTLSANNVSALPIVENNSIVASSGAAVTLPAVAQSTLNDITLTANCTITMPAATSGSSITVILHQDAVGSRTASWVTPKWPGGVVPTLSTAPNNIDVFTFICSGGVWLGFTSGIAMS